MEQLPEPLREVLVLRQLEELSVQETAAALGVPEGTVMSRHFRALARLRDLLEDDV
jgi:RNA polymerase sigma-70 factor (ECF subfamily)